MNSIGLHKWVSSLLKVNKGSEACEIDCIHTRTARFNNLEIGCQVKPRGEFDVVKKFSSLPIIKEVQVERGNFVTHFYIVKTYAKGIMISGGDEPFASQADTVKPFNRISAIIGLAETTEQPKPFQIFLLVP